MKLIGNVEKGANLADWAIRQIQVAGAANRETDIASVANQMNGSTD